MVDLSGTLSYHAWSTQHALVATIMLLLLCLFSVSQ